MVGIIYIYIYMGYIYISKKNVLMDMGYRGHEWEQEKEIKDDSKASHLRNWPY